jgi:hypothetical protein
MRFNTKYWLNFSLVNLMIVAILGSLMRFKIGFDCPYFEQINIQHSHSHFAFVGWVASTLYILIINFIQNKTAISHHKQYKVLIAANLICAYGMLVSFFVQGYGAISITFSTLTIVIACFFAYYFFKDFKKIENGHPSIAWFKAALWFNIFSSIGTFYLAYMMASGHFNENWYLASIYFYLHFQYNGFFIFSCFGLAINELPRILPHFKYDKLIFRLFFLSVIPGYFLSTLWAQLPIWLYTIVVIAAIVQVLAWFKFVNDIRKGSSGGIHLTQLQRYLLLFVAISFSIKILLQLGSTIPELGQLAFGFRAIVIAYLHLVLLAVITVFLLAYLYSVKLIHTNQWTITGLVVFTIGVLLNELVLATQGIESFRYISVSYSNETLFGAALILFLGSFLLVFSQIKNSEDILLQQ